MTGEGIVANNRIVTQGHRGQIGEEIVIEIGVRLIGTLHDLKRLVLIHAKGIFANGNIVANSDVLQLITVMEHSLADGHAVGDGDGGDVGKCKGIALDHRILRKGRQLGNAGFKECILTDLGQRTQGHSTQHTFTLSRTKGIGLHCRNSRQNHGGDAVIVAKCATAQGRRCDAAKGGRAYLAFQLGRYGIKGLSVGRQHMVCALDLINGIALFHHKGLHLGVTEGKLADHVHIATDDHTGQVFALIEHTLRQNGCVDGKFLQCFTIGEGIGTVLDLCGIYGNSIQLLTACKGIFTDGQQRICHGDGLQLITACKGVVGNDADGLKVQATLQRTTLKGVLADDL